MHSYRERDRIHHSVDWTDRTSEELIAACVEAVTPAAWDTAEMKKYAQDVPQALVARDQLQYSVAELSTHDNQRVTTALNNGLQAALTGSKSPADAMKDAQRAATRILKDFKK